MKPRRRGRAWKARLRKANSHREARFEERQTPPTGRRGFKPRRRGRAWKARLRKSKLPPVGAVSNRADMDALGKRAYGSQTPTGRRGLKNVKRLPPVGAV